MSLLTILIILLVISAAGGFWGHRNPAYGVYSWSPLAVLVVVLIVLFVAGILPEGRHGLRLR